MLRVTRILEAAGLSDPSTIDPWYLSRGSAIHEATALDDIDDLDEEAMDPAIANQVFSWRAFRVQAGLRIIHGEFEVVHPEMKYVGHLDRVVVFRGRHAPVLLDIKNGAPAAWHGAQTAAYALAWAHQMRCLTPERGAVYLQKDGSAARWVPHTDRTDFDTWKAALTIAHWKERHGLIKPSATAPDTGREGSDLGGREAVPDCRDHGGRDG